MDWLKKLPVVGPLITRLMLTPPWRAYERLDEVKWTQLAAAMTFLSFLALFPLITVAAAIGASVLSTSRRQEIQNKIADQVPGISDQLDLDSLVRNAGTVGGIAAALLLLTGIGWIGSMRECLRTVWELPDPEENPILRKAKDAGILAGLGGAGLASLIVSALTSTALGWLTGLLGIDEGGVGGVFLAIAAFAVAVLADFLLLLYVLTLLPGAEPDRRPLLTAALIGALGFELLKLLLGGYMQRVAGKSMYGAFGVPIALMLWINFTAKLLLFCAAWTATQSRPPAVTEGTEAAEGTGSAEGTDGDIRREDRAGANGGANGGGENGNGGREDGGTASGATARGSHVSGEGGGAPGPAAASGG